MINIQIELGEFDGLEIFRVKYLHHIESHSARIYLITFI